MAKLHILLPIHNRKKNTEYFINNLLKQTFQNFHLIVIDDGSTDGSAELIKKIVPSDKITIIQGRGNLWWSGSLQQGYKWLKNNVLNNSDRVLIINDDVEIDNTFLENGLNILECHPKTLLGAECYDLATKNIIDNGVFINWKRLSFNSKYVNTINCLSTRGLLLRFVDFKKIRGFYPLLLPHYLSDYEFTIRAHRKGYKLITNPNFKLYNDLATTGFHSIEEKKFIPFLKKYFSKKNANNPVYWITFILLACPMKYKLLNILRIMFSFAKITINHIFFTKK